MRSLFSILSRFSSQKKLNTSDDINTSMTIQLDKINPKFRQLTDLLFFSDRMDIDLAEFKPLLKENYESHFDYMWDRFCKSAKIFWEEGPKFWENRLAFLLSLNDKALSKKLEEHLEKRMFDTVRAKHEVDIRYDIEYLQFLEFCKAKLNRQESLLSVKNYFTEMPSSINAEKLIGIVNTFIPVVFSSIDEYVEIITKRITTSARNFEFLLSLEKKGITFDKTPIINLVRSLLLERVPNDKNRRAFFTLINDDLIRNSLKLEYQASYRDKLLDVLKACDHTMIEEHHLRNVKNVLDLDSNISDELAVIYADRLYQRSTGHKKANADRLIRLLKMFPRISPKKILSYLSSNNKMSDIKYILNAFPDLRKLAAFV